MARSTTRKAAIDVDGLLAKLERFLQKKALKLTHQRRQLVEQILAMDKTHFTADDLVDQFRDQRPRISKATVYRTLSVLVESGLLEEHQFGENHKVYEVAEGRGHHDHLICTSCNKIIEFFNANMEQLQDKVTDEYGFHPTHHSQKIYGLCANCWTKRS